MVANEINVHVLPYFLWTTSLWANGKSANEKSMYGKSIVSAFMLLYSNWKGCAQTEKQLKWMEKEWKKGSIALAMYFRRIGTIISSSFYNSYNIPNFNIQQIKSAHFNSFTLKFKFERKKNYCFFDTWINMNHHFVHLLFISSHNEIT